MRVVILVVLNVVLLPFIYCLPDQGQWNITFTEREQYVGVYKSLQVLSPIYIRFSCSRPDMQITVGWTVRTTPCWNEYLYLERQGGADSNLSLFYTSPDTLPSPQIYNITHFEKFEEITVPCDKSVLPLKKSTGDLLSKLKSSSSASESANVTRLRREAVTTNAQYITPSEDIYLMVVHVTVPQSPPEGFSVSVYINMVSPYKEYLSVADWPNLPFYAVMTVVYLVYLLFWMIVCCMRWRELLRIQYWIGAVILTGFIEKAAFLAEYDAVNRTGVSMYGSVIFAEIVSCMKRAMARILVIVVSVGFGITKPRLGPLLHRVLLVGIVYFVFASIESCSRTLRPRNQLSSDVMISSVVLAIMDSALSWWVFTSLVNTTRTLRLRRNEVKLSLYRHFTNTLIFCVIASVAFMAWSVHFHKTVACLRQWNNLWTEEACWHVLFSIILAVIMVLWRPTNNNQRYAFTPLLDSGDGDDEEDELFRTETFHDVKMRTRSSSAGSQEHRRPSRQDSDEDLKWVEDNIPASMAESALPVMDSDEEVMNAKFEISKMQ